MRAPFLILITLLIASAAKAEALRLPASEPPRAGKALPLKGASTTAKANACASYGAGFHLVEATGTCVKIGGAISVDAAVRR
ncbi:porin [Bradyrhizobium huanghuaihaiense]|uniref:porin n=1 Tax=Bradyrhizobium huanghuaihaiense TaxID=990078 RepID=UPI0021A98AB0|nr:porin [Bradyrhizobium sp. CB3035]UWU73114.1 porin [Bradyrhizobium sp. CB3035]